MERLRRLRRVLRLALDVIPLLRESLDVTLQLFLGRTLGGGAHDHADARGQHLLEDLLQAGTLGVRKLAADAVHRVAGDVHEVAAGQRHLAREASTLVSDRVLRDLHEHLVPRLECVLNLARLVGTHFGCGPVDLTRIEHSVARATDIDECCFHAREHVLHTTDVDIADQRHVFVPGDVVLNEDVVLEHTDLYAVVLRAHEHLAVNRLATCLELALSHGHAAATRVAAFATTRTLRGETGRSLNLLRFGDRLLLFYFLDDLVFALIIPSTTVALATILLAALAILAAAAATRAATTARGASARVLLVVARVSLDLFTLSSARHLPFRDRRQVGSEEEEGAVGDDLWDARVTLRLRLFGCVRLRLVLSRFLSRVSLRRFGRGRFDLG